MRKVGQILKHTEYTMDEFWAIVEELPDEIGGKKYKKKIKAFFKKNGDPKSTKKNLTAQENQDLHEIQIGISKHVRSRMHVKKIKAHRNARIEIAKLRRAGILSDEDYENSSLLKKAKKLTADKRKRQSASKERKENDSKI